MARNAPGAPAFCFLLIAAVLLVGNSFIAEARGAREDPVEQAEELVEANRLNEAVELLESVLERQPERFDEAERLLRRIRGIRNEFNELFAELVDVLETEPDNYERALELLDAMEELDAAPSPRAAREIERRRTIVTLRYNVARFDRLTEEAVRLMANGQHLRALELYIEELGLLRDEFRKEDYDRDRVVQPALEAEEELRELGRDALDGGNRLSRTVEGIEEADTEELLPTQELLDHVQQIHAIERRLVELGARMTEVSRITQRVRQDDSLDPYPTFLSWFAYGRRAGEGHEGMSAAVRGLLEKETETVTNVATVRGDDSFSAGVDAFERASFAASAAEFEHARRSFELLELISSAHDRQATEIAAAAPEARHTHIARRVGETHGAATSRFAADRVATASQLLDEGLAEIDYERAPLGELEQYTDELEAVHGSLALLRQNLDAPAPEPLLDTVGDADTGDALPDRAAAEESEVPESDRARAETAVEIVEQALEVAADEAAQALGAVIARERQRLEDSLTELRREAASAEHVAFQGVSYEYVGNVPEQPDPVEHDPEETEERLYRYPQLGRDRLDPLREEVQGLRSAVEQRYRQAADASPFIHDRPPLDGERRDLAALLEAVEREHERIHELFDRAEQRVADAAELRDDVREILDRAEQRVAEDPDGAQDDFDRAQDALVEALDYQQDPEFRAAVDERLVELGTLIHESRHELAVRQVRELIREGRRLYRLDRFREAQNILHDAEERWHSVNERPNSEIQYWLRLTEAALNLQTDRELADTDPLFRPLGRYLSLAEDKFEQAEEAVEEGNAERAEDLLEEAEEHIASVVVARPFNRDARVLSLRIIELLEPEEFPDIFEQRFQRAQELAEEDPMEALNDLYDLQEIDPDFPGLEQEIENLEIELGIRPPPVDEEALTESEALYEDAQTLAESEAQADLEEAVAKLEQAVELDPDNDDASGLLDQVRLRLGSDTRATLSSGELQDFRRAENHYLDGRAGQALAIVEQLWREEDNRRYEPLSDLRRRILGES